MADDTDHRTPPTQQAILVLLGLVFVPVLVVHAIALLASG
jgi:hypothetical protein